MVVDFFVGGSNKNVAIHKVIRTFDEKVLYPVISVEKLLGSVGRKEALKNIKETLTELPEEYYDALYKELIYNFVSFVQILPVNNEARLASLMDEGLMRALYSLQVYQKSKNEAVDPVMSYVLFSAALLFDIGCVIADRTIIISKEDGDFIKIWNPFCDQAISEGSYYKIRQGGGLTPWSIRRSAITLACKLMPVVGFDWIYKNPHAFDIWLSLLVDDKEGAGFLGFSFERARELLEEFKISNEIFAPVDVEELEGQATKNAEKFMAWFKNELGKGRIAEGQVCRIDDQNKLFISKDVIKKFLVSADVKNSITYEDLEYEVERIGLTFLPWAVASGGASLAREIRTRLGAISMTLFNISDSRLPTATATTAAGSTAAATVSASNTNKISTPIEVAKTTGGYIVSGNGAILDTLVYAKESGVRKAVPSVSAAALGLVVAANLPSLTGLKDVEELEKERLTFSQ